MGNILDKQDKYFGQINTWTRENNIINGEIHYFEISKNQTSIKCIDMRDKFLSDKDELYFSSVINSVVNLCEYYNNKNKPIYEKISKLFIVYNIVKNSDKITLSNCIKSINEYGYCLDSSWPYMIDKIYEKPSVNCYNEAIKEYKFINFKTVSQDLEQLKQCILDGNPFIVGINLYDNFDSSNSTIKKPNKHNKIIGGIMITIIGFKEDREEFIFKSPFGITYGEFGFGYISYDYIINSNHASDIRIINNCDNIIFNDL